MIRTSAHCKSEMKNLIDEYKRISDANGKSGNSRHDFVYYDLIDEVLGCRDSAKPAFTVDVGSSNVDENDDTNESNDSDDKIVDSNESIESAEQSTSSDSTIHEGEKGTTLKKKSKGKRKRKDDEEVGELVSYLQESEKREKEFFLRLAEMEERQQERNMKFIAEIAKMLKN